jgi:toxin secretion/phage lysis holin
MNTFKVITSILIGCIATFFDKYGLIIGLVAFAVVLDFATGLTKSKITGKKLDSKTGTIGLFKKMAMFLALTFGIFMDYFIPLLAKSGLQLDFKASLPFGLIVGVYIIVNEAISISENLYAFGVKLPKFIVELLKIAESEIGQKEGK